MRDRPILDTSRNTVHRLFHVPPGAIFEHPEGYSLVMDEIPDGPITGWDAYAPNLWRGQDSVVGPFLAIVSRPYDDRSPVIDVRISESEGYEFNFGVNEEQRGTRFQNRACWFQSGATLRFIRAKS